MWWRSCAKTFPWMPPGCLPQGSNRLRHHSKITGIPPLHLALRVLARYELGDLHRLKMSQSCQVCGWARFHQTPKMACNLVGELETGIYRLWKCLGRSSDIWRVWLLFCILHLKVNLENCTTWKLLATYPLEMLHKKLYTSEHRTELVKKWGYSPQARVIITLVLSLRYSLSVCLYHI